jgi:serine protease Do
MNRSKALQQIVILFCAATILAGTAASAAAKPASPAPPADIAAARALSGVFNAAAERVQPSVVSVYSEKVVKFRNFEWSFPFNEDSPFRRFFDQPQDEQRAPRRRSPREYRVPQRGLGSGIIMDKEGHILTNNHVVHDVDEIKVTLADKRVFDAEIVGTDAKTDLAIIKIKGKVPDDLPIAELGDSDVLRVGDWVLAIGAPFGYAQTVTLGIVSAKGRVVGLMRDDKGSLQSYEDFIQTDAAINPGNSGGPLVNIDGQVVGINSVIATSIGQYAGVGFAIPSSMVKQVMPVLLKGGKVTRGMLGVMIQEIDSDLAKQFGLSDTKGVLIAQVNKDSPAEKAGIKVGDVILRFDGKAVEDTSYLRNLVAATVPGTKADVVVLRDGKEKTIRVTIGTLTAETGGTGAEEGGETESASSIGITVAPLTADKAKELGYEKDEGVLITEVEDNSPAARAELRPGDLITEINRDKVTSVAQCKDAVAKAKDKESILVLIKRQGASRFVIVKLK